MAILCVVSFVSFNTYAKKGKSTPKKTKQTSQIIKEGYYYICAADNPNYVIGCDPKEDLIYQNINLCRYNGSDAQKWYIHYWQSERINLYIISSALDENVVISVGDSDPFCFLSEYNFESDENEIWQIEKNGNNAYHIRTLYGGNGVIGKDKDSLIYIYLDEDPNSHDWILRPVK